MHFEFQYFKDIFFLWQFEHLFFLIIIENNWKINKEMIDSQDIEPTALNSPMLSTKTLFLNFLYSFTQGGS
jgi:hypothetical protein